MSSVPDGETGQPLEYRVNWGKTVLDTLDFAFVPSSYFRRVDVQRTLGQSLKGDSWKPLNPKVRLGLEAARLGAYGMILYSLL